MTTVNVVGFLVVVKLMGYSSCPCRMLMGRDVGLEDLSDVHPDICASLKKLLAYDGAFSELGLVFQV